MELPFSDAEFFEVFSAYNSALWPFAAALWLISLAAFIQVLRGKQSDRAVTALLAVHWGWAGLAYHLAYFTAINPAAFAFALGFRPDHRFISDHSHVRRALSHDAIHDRAAPHGDASSNAAAGHPLALGHHRRLGRSAVRRDPDFALIAAALLILVLKVTPRSFERPAA